MSISQELGVSRKHPLAKCEDCPLFEEGKFVPSDGPAKAKLAIVGEAPGANEARVGKPFIGESGQLLTSVLRHYKMDRKEILLTNAALCRSPDGATPTGKALEACRPRLLHELRDRGVQDVVALGNSASKSVLSTSVGITSLRIGRGHTNDADLPGVRVVCTFHPAAALRQPDFFPSIVTDFGKLKDFVGTWYEPKWKPFEEPEEALLALAELQQMPNPVTVDIEAGIEKDVSFEHPNRHDLLCVGLEYEKGKGIVIGETACKDERVLRALAWYLITHKVKAQNGKFDLKGLFVKLRKYLEEFNDRLRLYSDSMLKSYCLDERPRVHSLEYLGIERLGTPNWKHELDKYKSKKDSYAVIPRPVLYKYNAFDIHVTWLVDDVLDRELQQYPELVKLHEFLCRASDELMYVELNGIGIDLKYNDELSVQYQASLGLLEERIAQAIPDPTWTDFNPRSPLQVKKVVKEVFGLRLPMKMNTKREYAETTDVEALTSLLERNLGGPSEEFFRRMLEQRKEQKLYGTYVKGIRRRVYRGRVYPTFLLHGTTTGRLSCRNPNLQNIPRDSTMRKQFVPCRTGNVFVEGDYAQNEGRVLCWLAQDEYLRKLFNDPTRDIFDELTPVLYGDCSGLSKAEMKELRIRVKAYFYGLAYGRESRSIALEYKVSPAEAERGMREFFKVIPATVAFRERTRQTVLKGNDLITAFGRHRRFYLITNSNRKDVLNEALAFLPQSTASDICLDAFIHVRPRLKGIGFIRNIVHDSLLGECHPDDVMEMTSILNEEMLASAARIVGDYVQFKVDFKSGPSWGELT